LKISIIKKFCIFANKTAVSEMTVSEILISVKTIPYEVLQQGKGN
jgi:hypothetical protein